MLLLCSLGNCTTYSPPPPPPSPPSQRELKKPMTEKPPTVYTPCAGLLQAGDVAAAMFTWA